MSDDLLDCLSEFGCKGVTSEATRQDGAIGAEDNDVGDALDAVQVGRLGQLVITDDDGPGDVELLDGLAGILGGIPHCDVHNVKLIAILVLEGL